MLDILLAIKNNNVTKIPNYDTSYSEHLKKIMKGFIRKGNYVTQLNISLEDLLKANERGKWWVVGSAWTGMDEKKTNKEEKSITPTYSKNLLELAKKQRMNTDTRRNIFCIIMTAEVSCYSSQVRKLVLIGKCVSGLFGCVRKIITFRIEKSTRKRNYSCHITLLFAREEI